MSEPGHLLPSVDLGIWNAFLELPPQVKMEEENSGSIELVIDEEDRRCFPTACRLNLVPGHPNLPTHLNDLVQSVIENWKKIVVEEKEAVRSRLYPEWSLCHKKVGVIKCRLQSYSKWEPILIKFRKSMDIACFLALIVSVRFFRVSFYHISCSFVWGSTYLLARKVLQVMEKNIGSQRVHWEALIEESERKLTAAKDITDKLFIDVDLKIQSALSQSCFQEIGRMIQEKYPAEDNFLREQLDKCLKESGVIFLSYVQHTVGEAEKGLEKELQTEKEELAKLQANLQILQV